MKVILSIPAVEIEQLEENKHNAVRTETPTRVVIEEDVTENPNFDYYLQPRGDLLYSYFGHSAEFSYGGTEFRRTDAQVEISFDGYAAELIAAAEVRAAEDHTDVHTVLRDWRSRAKGEYTKVAQRLGHAIEQAKDDEEMEV